MGVILSKYGPRISGIEYGTWELFEGYPEPELWFGSNLMGKDESNPNSSGLKESLAFQDLLEDN